MKALKAVVVVAVSGSLLVGCGSDWTGDVRFKVTRIAPARESMGEAKKPFVVLELDQEQPDGIPEITTEGADSDQFPADIKVGDVVVCTLHRSDDNGLDGVEAKQTVGPCRRA
ncbi:hypothetical protein ABZ816_12685 [Actinosynnema sp. NPDC047251]|uniref:Uncharacterized protein n=1 Tax=Saccharothrix espanaensis (strain ATCC 51144 / DSM 44229 / JCM 9112 / NBRC 15066 / NRRL 15764) TaxID=1179773 RepID=K0KD02_SACES|nr:hypothetical protein [Saccharothrix espanaensis]CCH35452.1 hypothetical protein BN6_82350 [Saccharothrix espanaensis DSM 44229]